MVIRNLVITAQWDAADVDHSQQAMSFGPFKIDSGIANGAIRNPGLQTIGCCSTCCRRYRRDSAQTPSEEF